MRYLVRNAAEKKTQEDGFEEEGTKEYRKANKRAQKAPEKAKEDWIDTQCKKVTEYLIKGRVNNDGVCRMIQAAIEKHDELLTLVKRRKLRWFGHIPRSSGLVKTI